MFDAEMIHQLSFRTVYKHTALTIVTDQHDLVSFCVHFAGRKILIVLDQHSVFLVGQALSVCVRKESIFLKEILLVHRPVYFNTLLNLYQSILKGVDIHTQVFPVQCV